MFAPRSPAVRPASTLRVVGCSGRFRRGIRLRREGAFMSSFSRRGFLKASAALPAALLLEQSIARAVSLPANRAHGSIEDVEHIVVLMQENRSFDSYYATLRGVRGFGDPHPAKLAPGKDVWHQSDGTREVLPFHPGRPGSRPPFIEDLDHSWEPTHRGLQRRAYDKWLPTKTPATMVHFDARRHPVPLRARGRVHGLRRLPLLAARPDGSQPLLHVDRLDRQRRQGQRAGPVERGVGLRLDHLSRSGCSRPA